MDVHKRLEQLLKERKWTRYRLGKECDLSDSTITNIFKRGNTPTIYTLETICKGLNITISQFFAEDEMVELNPELKELFDEWIFLTAKQKEAVLQLIKTMHNEK